MMTIIDMIDGRLFFALRLVTPNAHCLGGFIVRSVMDLLVLGAVNFCLPFIMVLFR